MAHFAQLDKDNRVIQVIVVSNDNVYLPDGSESEEVGVAFCRSLLGEDTNWVQTSYNGNFRGKYAGIGDKYNPTKDEFEYDQKWIDEQNAKQKAAIEAQQKAITE